MAGYIFCPTCRKEGRTRRITEEQMIEFGQCKECQSKEENMAQVAEATGAATPAAAKEPKAKVAKTGTCICGCGGTTKGGKFLPGHDARFHGLLKRGLTEDEARAIGALPDAERIAKIKEIDAAIKAKNAPAPAAEATA